MQEGQKEKRQHGDISLPVDHYHTEVPVSYTLLEPHWHEEMEVTLILEGVCSYHVEGELFEAREGTILLIPPHGIHSSSAIRGQKMISESLVFHLDFLGAKGTDITGTQYLHPLQVGEYLLPPYLKPGNPGYEDFKKVFLTALSCYVEKPPAYELMLKTYLTLFLGLLFQHGYCKPAIMTSRNLERRQKMKQILTYINLHCDEKISVGDLAAESGLSESHFMYDFKRHVGMTCVEYINYCRLQRAKGLLQTTELGVAEIAMRCGFDNISYFNRCFKEAFRQTPTALRRSYVESD